MRKFGTAMVVVISLVGATFGVLAGVAQAAGPPFSFGPHTEFGTGGASASVAMGDLDGDAVLDLVAVNYSSSTVSVLLGNGSGGFGSNTDYSTGTDPYALALGDLNGDTLLDLAVTNYVSDSVSVRLGNGTGGFGARTDVPVGDGPYSVAVGDLNGDTSPDLAVANSGTDTVSVLPGDGTGGFGAKTDFTTANGPTSVSVSDLNGDTFLDLVVAAVASDSVSVLLANGAGGFGAKTDFATGDGPYALALGDLDGDSSVDLATSNYTSDSVSVLLGDGAGGFGAKTDFATGSGPMFVAVGDLNGDAFLDVAAANYLSNSVSVLPGDGAGGFGAKTDFATIEARSVALGDLDGDTRLDLVVPNYYASPSVSVLLNTTGDNPAIVVTPDTDLVDGQTVGIEGFGWEPGHTIGFCQAAGVDPPGASNCDDGVYSTVTADSFGSFTGSLTVQATIYVPSLGVEVDCTDPSDPCVLGAADGADVAGTAMAVPLHFAPVVTVPGAPTIGTAVGGNGEATVSWATPASNGGSAITGYVVTPYVSNVAQPDQTFMSTAVTQTVIDLTNGTSYTFKVAAINAVGTGAQSAATSPILIGVPGAPAPVSALAGALSATVSWTVPADNGSAITGYTIFVGIPGSYSPERIVNVGPSVTTLLISGLTAGAEHFFRVAAINGVGTGPYARSPGKITIGP